MLFKINISVALLNLSSVGSIDLENAADCFYLKLFQRGGDNHDDDNHDVGVTPDTTCTGQAACCKGISKCAHMTPNYNGGDNHKDKDHAKLFQGHNNEIKEVPAIPQMNFATITNGTTRANVTIPVCNGVVGGPCLDPNTHTIIP
jgi:hypothetical protein